MTNADYGQGAGFTTAANAYNVAIEGYDFNGNILELSRFNKDEGEIDNLTYTYFGNQLLSIADKVSNSKSLGFFDGNNSDVDYLYDACGNMVTDRNMALQSLEYNAINMLSKVTDTNNRTIEYIYSADGTKLMKNATDGTTIKYVGNFVYENNTLQYIMHSEGKYVVNGTGGEYQYSVKDHLGNVRLVVGETGTELQQNAYYPFGLQYNTGGSSDNKHLHGGNEWQDDAIGNGLLSWFDLGTRMYDPLTGRFFATDRWTEKNRHLSPYSYASNNPISNIDYLGLLSTPVWIEGHYETDDNGKEVWIKGFWQDANSGLEMMPSEVIHSMVNDHGIPQTDAVAIASSGNANQFANNEFTAVWWGIDLSDLKSRGITTATPKLVLLFTDGTALIYLPPATGEEKGIHISGPIEVLGEILEAGDIDNYDWQNTGRFYNSKYASSSDESGDNSQASNGGGSNSWFNGWVLYNANGTGDYDNNFRIEGGTSNDMINTDELAITSFPVDGGFLSKEQQFLTRIFNALGVAMNMGSELSSEAGLEEQNKKELFAVRPLYKTVCVPDTNRFGGLTSAHREHYADEFVYDSAGVILVDTLLKK